MEENKEEKKEILTYLITDGNLYKIGKSIDPEKRFKQLKTANPYIEMVCYGNGVSEAYLHSLFFQKRKSGEWFDLSDENLQKCVRLISEGEKNTFGELKYKKKRFINSDGKIVICDMITWNLTDQEIKDSVDSKKHSIDLNKKYVINFGKYKNTKIIDMVTQEQYEYCEWFLDTYSKTLSKNAKKKDRKYKAFSWWVRLGYKEHLRKSNNN